MANYKILEGLSEQDKEFVLNLTSKKIIPAKNLFIKQGEIGRSLFLIEKGSINVFITNIDGKELSITILGPGDIVRELSLLDKEERSAFAKSLTEATLLEINENNLTKLFQEKPNITRHLLTSLASKIRATNLQAEENITIRLKEKTLNTLLTLKAYFPDGKIALTQEELASILGATRPRVNEALNELENENKIKSIDHYIIVLS